MYSYAWGQKPTQKKWATGLIPISKVNERLATPTCSYFTEHNSRTVL